MRPIIVIMFIMMMGRVREDILYQQYSKSDISKLLGPSCIKV